MYNVQVNVMWAFFFVCSRVYIFSIIISHFWCELVLIEIICCLFSRTFHFFFVCALCAASHSLCTLCLRIIFDSIRLCVCLCSLVLYSVTARCYRSHHFRNQSNRKNNYGYYVCAYAFILTNICSVKIKISQIGKKTRFVVCVEIFCFMMRIFLFSMRNATVSILF